MDTARWWCSTSSIAVFLGSAWISPVAAQPQDWGPWGMHMMWGSWGIGMMLMMFLFWALLIAGLIFVIRWLITTGGSGRQGGAEHGSESAFDILQKRYARGEITKQEFEEIRRDLQ